MLLGHGPHSQGKAVRPGIRVAPSLPLPSFTFFNPLGSRFLSFYLEEVSVQCQNQIKTPQNTKLWGPKAEGFLALHLDMPPSG